MKPSTQQGKPSNPNNKRSASPSQGQQQPSSQQVASTQQQQPAPAATATTTTQQRSAAGQKNVKPASLTYQNNGASVKNNNDDSSQNTNNSSNAQNNSSSSNNRQPNKNAQRQQQQRPTSPLNAREERRSTNRSQFNSNNSTTLGNGSTGNDVSINKHGLAGVDLNNASVYVIDNQPDVNLEDLSDSGEFEEVLSRKAKKQQKQLQQQIEEKERQKSELSTKRRFKEFQKKNPKKTSREEPQKQKQRQTSESLKSATESLSPISAADSGVVAVSSTSQVSAEVQESISNTINNSLVWNSASVLPPVIEKFTQTTIPAPIARPTSKAKLEFEPHIEIPAEKDLLIYPSHHSIPTDFDFSGGQSSPANTFINDDHVELQKKVSKVKDFWPGEKSDYLANDLLKSPDSGNEKEVKEQNVEHGSSVKHQQRFGEPPLVSGFFNQGKVGVYCRA